MPFHLISPHSPTHPPSPNPQSGNDYIHQLKLITRTIGTPSEADLWFVKNPKAKAFMLQLPSCPPQDMSKRFPSASPLALDLLTHMLQLDYKRRITVDAALAHPYFASVRDPAMEFACPSPVPWGDIERCPLSRPNLQRTILEDVVAFHPHEAQPLLDEHRAAAAVAAAALAEAAVSSAGAKEEKAGGATAAVVALAPMQMQEQEQEQEQEPSVAVAAAAVALPESQEEKTQEQQQQSSSSSSSSSSSPVPFPSTPLAQEGMARAVSSKVRALEGKAMAAAAAGGGDLIMVEGSDEKSGSGLYAMVVVGEDLEL
jgi:serine/threonine protein kinase